MKNDQNATCETRKTVPDVMTVHETMIFKLEHSISCVPIDHVSFTVGNFQCRDPQSFLQFSTFGFT